MNIGGLESRERFLLREPFASQFEGTASASLF